MAAFITNQSQLAQALGISSSWFTTVKDTHCASDELLVRLEALTGISQVYWASPKRKRQLNQQLKAFLAAQKEQAETSKNTSL